MSQEIQLSLTPSGTALPQQTPSWSGPNPTALATAAPNQVTPLGKVHEVLRGRYLITCVFAGIFALMGAGLGAFVFHAGYQSVGVIEIDPVIPSLELYDHIMPLYQAKIATIVNNLHTERVIREAMESPEWKAHRPLRPEAYLGGWQKDLVVKMAPNSFDITITYTDDHKDGKEVAPIAVTSLIKAYEAIDGDEDKRELDAKLASNTRTSTGIEQKMNEETKLIDTYLRNSSEDIQFVVNEKLHNHVVTEHELKVIQDELQRKKEALAQAEAQAKTAPPSAEDLARVDSFMATAVNMKLEAESLADSMEERYGKENPGAHSARQKADLQSAIVSARRDELNSQYFIFERPDGNGGILVKKDLTLEESTLKRKRQDYNDQAVELEDLGHREKEISKLRADKTRNEEKLLRVNKVIEDIKNEREMINTFKVRDYGGVASIATDKRIAFGALGFLAGGGFPVGLMLLLSLMNPRFRFSDEATQSSSSGLTLLGILPDLPDRLSDPEQASIAAHCVHQIRTMLQINTTGTDERRVFAITSAAPGDGKTSLTLALGLSYAACGTRTLLIDCDLVGLGLTTRMNIVAEEGVLEAIAHRTLLEYVRSTDIADVSILPVGSNQHLHASTLSPAALRRLIEEAKKHFDTILIDTGPVLGSIEASLVAAAADAVVLTVSRGQQRPLVEKTVQHLKNIKANLAGLVFNRAQTADFDRSISGISLRSASAGSGHNAPRMGPVARAVQSAFKPAGEEDAY